MANVVVENNVEIGIKVGDHFNSVVEFDKILENVCKDKYVQYFKRDSRTVEAAKKKVKRYLNPKLQFYQVKYCCIHGGKKHVQHGLGQRNKKTLRKEELCPSFVNLKASKCGNLLEVVQIETKHNHVIDKQLFLQLPSQRKLPLEIKESTKRLLALNANKQLLRHELEKETNKIIKLKDLSNLQQENRLQYSNSIEASTKKIFQKFRSDSYLLVDTENIFKGLMFCTPTMKIYMNAFPELLCIDATYKLLNIRAPVYLILLEDGNGESIVVAVGVLVREDKESLIWFLEKFKEMNPAYTKTVNIMADKDWNERDVLKEAFPNAKILICIFHALKIFQREITVDKMKISSSERTLALTLIQELMYAKNEEQFLLINTKITSKLSKSVVQYLEQHWLNIREEWCPYLGIKNMNFMNTTNNRIENINGKLKTVIKKNSSLEEFVDRLFIIIKSLEKEQKSRLADKINKRYIYNFPENSAEYKYEKLVSEYAFQKILGQISLKNKIIITNNHKNFLTKSLTSNTSYETSQTQCTCYFFCSMGLPCKHLFAILEYSNADLFNTSFVKTRWTQEYIMKNQIFFPNFTDQSIHDNVKDNLNCFENPNIEISEKTTNKIYSQQEKYKITIAKCKLIASLASETSGEKFKSILNELDKCVEILANNKTFKIQSELNLNDTEETEEELNISDNCDLIENNEELNRNDDCDNFETTKGEFNIYDNFIENTRENLNISNNCDIIENTEEELTINDNFIENTGEYLNINNNCDIIENTEEEFNINDNFSENTGEYLNINNNCDIIEDTEEELNINDNTDIIENTESELNTNNNCDIAEYTEELNINGNCDIEDSKDKLNKNNNSNNLSLSAIKMPPKIKSRGRPKGMNQTAIGLPKKNKGIIPFKKFNKAEKVEIISSWIFLNPDNIYLKKKMDIIDLKDMKDINIKITEIKLEIIKPYLDENAFLKIKEYQKFLKKSGKWICPICSNNIAHLASIRCDKCLCWFHLNCLSLKSSNLNSFYFCPKCTN